MRNNSNRLLGLLGATAVILTSGRTTSMSTGYGYHSSMECFEWKIGDSQCDSKNNNAECGMYTFATGSSQQCPNMKFLAFVGVQRTLQRILVIPVHEQTAFLSKWVTPQVSTPPELARSQSAQGGAIAMQTGANLD